MKSGNGLSLDLKKKLNMFYQAKAGSGSNITMDKTAALTTRNNRPDALNDFAATHP